MSPTNVILLVFYDMYIKGLYSFITRCVDYVFRYAH